MDRRWSSGSASVAIRSGGKPLWVNPSSSPSRRSSRSISASAKPSWVARDGVEPGADDVVSVVGIGDQDAVRAVRAPPDTASQLVELGEPEAVGIEDEHDRRLGNVDADLDDGRAHEDVEVAGAEAIHDLVSRARRHLAVDHADARGRSDAERLRHARQDVVEHGRA